MHHGKIGRELGFHRDAPALRVGAEQLHHVGGGLVQIQGLPLELALAQQLSHAPDHLARPQVVLPDVGQDPSHFIEAPGFGLEQHLGRIGVAQDRPERLVDLVRDGGNQLAHHGEPRRMSEPLIRLLRPLAVRDVRHGADHPQRRSARSPHDEAALADVSVRAVDATHAAFRVPPLSAAVDHRLHLRGHPLLVLGVQQILPPGGAVAGRFRHGAQERLAGLVPPQLIGRHVPVENDVLGRLHHELEALVAPVQRVLGLLARQR